MDIMDVLLAHNEHSFYGVDNNCFKIGSLVLEAVADPNDGYRSYLAAVVITDDSGLIFSGVPLARVKVVKESNSFTEGYCLVDGSGHTWLRIGTDIYREHYPMFAFEYTPKEDKEE